MCNSGCEFGFHLEVLVKFPGTIDNGPYVDHRIVGNPVGAESEILAVLRNLDFFNPSFYFCIFLFKICKK